MSLDPESSEEPVSYYPPFVDLMSGLVFILIIVLCAEIINIKYPEVSAVVEEVSPSHSNQLAHEGEKVVLFKKALIASISSGLKERGVRNKISENSCSLIIYESAVFDKKGWGLTSKGRGVAFSISSVFDKILFLKSKESDVFRGYVDYIRSITIDVFSSSRKGEYGAAVSRSFTLYGFLSNLNKEFLSFSNSITPRLIRIQDVRSVPENLLRDLYKEPGDVILINFEFSYPQKEPVLW